MNLAPYVKVRREKFGALMFDKEREKFFVVNAVGRDVLQFMEGAETIQELVDGLSQAYSEPPEVIRQDVLDFIDGLRQAGLLLE